MATNIEPSREGNESTTTESPSSSDTEGMSMPPNGGSSGGGARPPPRPAAGGVARRAPPHPRREGAERADLVRAGLRDLAHHVHLIGADVGDGDVEPGSGVRPSAHPGIDAPQSRVQHVAQLLEGEVRDEHLADLRNQHESFARDL